MSSVRGIDIELQRDPPVFYAGEVVRGTVSFDIAGNTFCRGLQIHLIGESKVHWHTGAGDNRKDYYGKTTFQNQRHTLCGNYFKTGMIDEAGSDAIFGRTNGDGTVIIPCSDAEAEKMLLCCRVMDYDFGRKDDLLGELLIDAADLARSKQMLTFPLTSKGRPEKGEVVMSAKITPYSSYFPTTSNTNVGAGALPQQVLVVTVHSATGLKSADWVGRNDVYVQMYRPPPGKELLPGRKLPKPDKRTKLPPGRTTYPFAFQLRADAPGSAEIGVGDYSYVRYDLYAHAVFATWKDPKKRMTISVIPNRPVPTLALLGPVSQEVPPSPVYKCSCLSYKCCKEIGLVSTSLKLSRMAYAPGETLDISGKVVNDTGKEVLVKLVLRQDIVLHCSRISGSRSATGYSPRCVSVCKDYDLFRSRDGRPIRLSCSAHSEIDLGSITQTSPIIMPAVVPTFAGGVSHDETRSFYSCLKWTYSIELSVGLVNPCASEMQINFPLLVSSAPPFAEAVRRAKDERFDFSRGPWSLLTYAHQGPEPSDTTPTISGAEDGGSIVPALGTTGGSIISALGKAVKLTAGMNIIDARTSGYDMNAFYQPVVNTFSSTPENKNNFPPEISSAAGTSTFPSMSENLEGSDSTNIHQDPSVQGQDSSFDQFLSSVEGSYDKRQAVGRYVRNNPEKASQLTPDQVAQILSKVDFSLEQASVAREIAAGFERSNGFTCDHITSALGVCKYAVTDVAKALAPYANDPQNKDKVLDLIDFSFEKGDVAKFFKPC